MSDSPLSRSQHQIVEHEVQSMLERSNAFRRLPLADRQRIAQNTTAVASALAAQRVDPPPARRRSPAARPASARDPYSLGLADDPFGDDGLGAPPASPAPPVPDKWKVDERFQAEGVSAGVTQVGRLLNEVNFPAFVASLVKGTFNAVVDASIQQMKAYGELVNGVAMSLNDYRDQTVDVGEGRRQLASKYPGIFSLGPSEEDDGAPGLSVRDDVDEDAMPDFQREFGLAAPVEELDEAAVDMLVTAARTELARGRQQLLATTVLMGINRIIVTDGRINAKLKFNFQTTDTVHRDGTNLEYEDRNIVMEGEIHQGRNWVKGRLERPVPLLVLTTMGTSDAEIKASAEMRGEVSLNFKSETFPLEKMVNTDQMMRLNDAQAGARAVPAPAPPTVAAAPPPPAAPPGPAPGR